LVRIDTSEIDREFYQYKKDLLESGYTRDEALSEAYNQKAIAYGDLLQYAETDEEADEIRAMVIRFEGLSEKYFEKVKSKKGYTDFSNLLLD
tara:strand:- start:14 stop:289 length:276 start_codon:yes stop_codon:yes gene_type:complete